jgi:4-hydroxybenzoyl-CoA thioesterase
MEEFFGAGLGIDYADVLHKRNLSLPTVHLEADFRHRIIYGDRIEMELRVIRIGRTSIVWGYRGFRGDSAEEVVVEGQNTTVCVKTDTFEKIEVPDWLRRELEPYIN